MCICVFVYHYYIITFSYQSLGMETNLVKQALRQKRKDPTLDGVGRRKCWGKSEDPVLPPVGTIVLSRGTGGHVADVEVK